MDGGCTIYCAVSKQANGTMRWLTAVYAGSLSLYHSLPVQWNRDRAIGSVESNTCALPTMTSQTVL